MEIGFLILDFLPVKVEVGSAKSLLDNESDPGFEDIEVRDDFFEGLNRGRTFAVTKLFEPVEVDDDSSLEARVSTKGGWMGGGIGVSIVAKVTTFFSLRLASVKCSSGSVAVVSNVRGTISIKIFCVCVCGENVFFFFFFFCSFVFGMDFVLLTS